MNVIVSMVICAAAAKRPKMAFAQKALTYAGDGGRPGVPDFSRLPFGISLQRPQTDNRFTSILLGRPERSFLAAGPSATRASAAAAPRSRPGGPALCGAEG